MDIIDRVCMHALLYCPEGCHDRMLWVPDNRGTDALADLVEGWANGDLSDTELELDKYTLEDGLDQMTVTAMLLMHEEDR